MFVHAGAWQRGACQQREGQRMARAFSPFLRFNMTPLALRLRQLHMHMPAILFVVGDYWAIKAPEGSSAAGAPELLFPSLAWGAFSRPPGPCENTGGGASFCKEMNGGVLISGAVVESHHLQTAVKRSLCKRHYSTGLVLASSFRSIYLSIYLE